jgi:hypothetical protein
MAIELSTLTFTNQADIVPQSGTEEITNTGIANTLGGNDEITGTGIDGNGISNSGTINTGNGNDTINGTGGAYGIFNANDAAINTGNGNDIISGTATGGSLTGIFNGGTINTGNGNDIITGAGSVGIYNDGIISTGNGQDIVDAVSGGFSGTGTIQLGRGNDILKGFGSGFFEGGSSKDTLELTSGSYTVGILGTTVSFTSNGIIMNTSEFEKLIAGSTTYDFTSLSSGQTITIA